MERDDVTSAAQAGTTPYCPTCNPPFVVFRSERPLSKAQVEQIRMEWERKHAGPKRPPLIVLPDGCDLQAPPLSLKDRFTIYVHARKWGWMTINEIRKLEGLPPIEGGDTISPNDRELGIDFARDIYESGFKNLPSDLVDSEKGK